MIIFTSRKRPQRNETNKSDDIPIPEVYAKPPGGGRFLRVRSYITECLIQLMCVFHHIDTELEICRSPTPSISSLNC